VKCSAVIITVLEICFWSFLLAVRHNNLVILLSITPRHPPASVVLCGALLSRRISSASVNFKTDLPRFELDRLSHSLLNARWEKNKLLCLSVETEFLQKKCWTTQAAKTRDSRLSYGEDPESLSHLPWIRTDGTGSWRTDRRTDRRTDCRIPIANMRSQQYLPVRLWRVKMTCGGELAKQPQAELSENKIYLVWFVHWFETFHPCKRLKSTS